MGVCRGFAGLAVPWVVFVFVAVSGTVHGQVSQRGRELFVLCAACHGEKGEGNVQRAAPAIAGLPQWYVAAQLEKFLSGQRGYHPQDDSGLQMRPMAQAVRRKEDQQAVAAYIASLPRPHPVATTDGQPAQGQSLYATCAACHGADGRGNEALKAPPLVGQNDWYIVAQLKKFKEGIRGADPQDASGQQMRAMVNVLPDETAVRNVAAYIRTLSQ
jgi:cytochrome c553